MTIAVKPRLPRGLADRNAADLAATDKMLAKIREVYELYGFAAVETPFIEFTEALGKFLPDTDRPNEGVFSFQDDDQQWLSLRYDLTAPLARKILTRCQSRIAPTGRGMCFAMRSPVRGGFASSCSLMPIRWARAASRRMRRFA